MDIKQLIYLCNLERERHFGRAAEASFVSQPTLSMRLKNLEKELGVSLINRGHGVWRIIILSVEACRNKIIHAVLYLYFHPQA